MGDLTTLSQRELGILLNEIDHDMDKLTPLMVDAEKALARAEVTLLLSDKPEVVLGAKTEKITQRAALKALTHQARHLKLRQSRVQSVLKSMLHTGSI